jgi:hypothetical protein
MHGPPALDPDDGPARLRPPRSTDLLNVDNGLSVFGDLVAAATRPINFEAEIERRRALALGIEETLAGTIKSEFGRL